MAAGAPDDPDLGPKIVAGIPAKRVAKARKIAGPVLFLCTLLANVISAGVPNANGGAVLVG